jgi:hypothetical protein
MVSRCKWEPSYPNNTGKFEQVITIVSLQQMPIFNGRSFSMPRLLLSVKTMTHVDMRLFVVSESRDEEKHFNTIF